MKQEDKELLLKDISVRLPYKTLISINGEKYRMEEIRNALIGIDTYKITVDGCDIEDWDIKPYLFPLSSMTEEQWMDTPYANLNRNFTFDSFKCGCSTLAFQTYEVDMRYVVDFINWCYKNHFDVNGLIPMGLAIDATGMNIYKEEEIKQSQ